jgi:hypothetical protein
LPVRALASDQILLRVQLKWPPHTAATNNNTEHT